MERFKATYSEIEEYLIIKASKNLLSGILRTLLFFFIVFVILLALIVSPSSPDLSENL